VTADLGARAGLKFCSFPVPLVEVRLLI
jgi:hypothetical protein